MDTALFLQQLRDLPVEEGGRLIQEYAQKAQKPPDLQDFSTLLVNEALKQLYTNPAISLKLAKHLVHLGDLVGDVKIHANGLKARGDALRAIGLHAISMDTLDAAGVEFLSLNDEVDWARSRISWIVSCAWLGRLEEALQEARRAHDTFEDLEEQYWACVVDHNTAVILNYAGRYQEAIHLYDRMLSVYPTLTGQSEGTLKRAIAMAKISKGRVISLTGKFDEAYSLIEEALATFLELAETNLAIISQSNLANIDYAQGYYGSALQRYYQARDSMIEQKIGDPWLLSILHLNIARCLVKLNRAPKACQQAAEVIEVYRQQGISLDTGDALREYAAMLAAARRIKEAIAVLDEAEVLFAGGGFTYHAAITSIQQSELLLKIGSPDAAYNKALSMQEYCVKQGLIARAVVASLVMIEALIEKTRRAAVSGTTQLEYVQEALVLCRQTALQARRHNLQEELYKTHHLMGRLYALQAMPGRAAQQYRSAIRQIERMLDNLVSDLSPSFLHTTWTVYEEMISLCLQRARPEEAFNYLERARSLALKQYLNRSQSLQGGSTGRRSQPYRSRPPSESAAILRAQQELDEWQRKYRSYSKLLAETDTMIAQSLNRHETEVELERCETKISELFERLHLYQSGIAIQRHTGNSQRRDTMPTGTSWLRQRLAPGQLLLAYFIAKENLVIFAATVDRLVTHEIPGGVDQLEQLQQFLYARLLPTSVSGQQEQAVLRILRKLYDLLIAPVAALLPASSGRITIVPYDYLHKFPFHALFDGTRYLVERFQINYLPASSILTRGNDESENGRIRPEQREAKPLILGYSGNKSLQRALEEAKALAAMLDGQCYLEGEATIARLMEQAPGSPIIHLATHGQMRLDAPNFSSVLLADGQLNAIDAFNFDLKACELVTLSGCETGLAVSGGGDEQLGLGRAFLAAGATSIVMSLWPVEDNATNELMQLFYSYLFQGESKVQALRLAQMDLLSKASSLYTHPYFWASFRVVGDAGPLKFRIAEPALARLKIDALKM